MSGRRAAIALLAAAWVVTAFSSPAAAHSARHSHVLTVEWVQGRPHLVHRHSERARTVDERAHPHSTAVTHDHAPHADHVIHALAPAPVLAPHAEYRVDPTWMAVPLFTITTPARPRPTRLLRPPPRRSDTIVQHRTTVLVV